MSVQSDAVGRPHWRGRRVAMSVLTLIGLVAGVLALSTNPVAAAPQTETIDFGDNTAAPASGSLANQVSWTVTQPNNGGWGVDTQWHLANSGPTTFGFDRPVDLRFGLDGLNASGETIVVSEGVVVDELHERHVWDETTRVLSFTSSCSSGCVSTFTLDDTTSLTVEPVGALTWRRHVAFIEVTYDLPVANVAGPVEGGAYTVGDGSTLDFACADGTGAVVGAATITGPDGTVEVHNGAALDQFGPGTYTATVACADENGALDVQTVTFTVEPAPVPACPENGLQVLEPPYLDLYPVDTGVSNNIHKWGEPIVRDVVDPILDVVGIDPLTPVVHDLDCDLVEPIEDVVDEILIPVVVATGLNRLLGGLFR